MKEKDVTRKKQSRKSQQFKELALPTREKEKLAARRKLHKRRRKREHQLKLAMTRTTADSDDEQSHSTGELALKPSKVYISRQAAGKTMEREGSSYLSVPKNEELLH